MTKNVCRTKVSLLFAQNVGREFFTVFFKLDGTRRAMYGIITVQDDTETRFLTVYDREAPGYRRVNIDTIYTLIIGNTEYRVR